MGSAKKVKRQQLELRSVISEKDATIQAQAALIERLESVLEQKSAQNEEIIGHYYRQYKELEQARQELKILQHDYAQMSTVYRISKHELQAKLDAANERISRLIEEKGGAGEEQQCRKKQACKRTSRRVTGSVASKVNVLGDASSRLNIPTIPEAASPPPTAPVVKQRAVSTSGRPVRRAAETVTSYKEPPLNTKMRRPF